MKRRRRSDLPAACLFLGPNFVGFLAFVAFPLIFSIVMAFTNWDLSLHNRFREDSIQWVWLRNFHDLLTHRDFWKYFGNTVFLMLGVPVGIAGSLFLASLLTRPLRAGRASVRWPIAAASLLGFGGLGCWFWAGGLGPVALVFCLLAGGVLALGVTTGATVYRTLFYLPHFTSGVAVFILWKQMYNPIRGPINQALQPALDSLARFVAATPSGLWAAGGYLLMTVAVAGSAWLLSATVRNWLDREFGFGTVLMGVATVTVGALILIGLGVVACRLPGWAVDGLETPNWLGHVAWAKPALMIMGFWAAVGSNNMLLYIAGISNIPQELYEAADSDGASRWQRFRHVTWPQLAPTTFFIVIMSVIGGLQGGFEQARAMTGGGPFGATTTMAYFVYNEGFETGRLGFASSVAWVIFVMVFAMTLINYRFGSRYVNE